MHVRKREALVRLEHALRIAGDSRPVHRWHTVELRAVRIIALRVTPIEGVLLAEPLVDAGGGCPAPVERGIRAHVVRPGEPVHVR